MPTARKPGRRDRPNDRPQKGGAVAAEPAGYFERAKRPLEILLFLLPLIAFYEVGLVAVLRHGGTVTTNKAHEALLRLFDACGLDAARLSLPALCLPGLLLVIVLLAWHVLSRQKWEADIRVVALMALESVVLAVPLYLAAQLIAQFSGAPLAAATDEALRTFPLLGKIAIAIGAGLYEELIFRMALVAVLHTLFVDALRWRERPAIIVAVVVSAIAFTLYHPLRDAHGALDWRRTASLFAAGLYFGAVFAARGFGIVVGAHAAYDIAAALGPE